MRKAFALFAVAAIAALTGCMDQRADIRPVREAKEALFRVNSNLAKIDRPLNCKGTVSLRFRDTAGKQQVFIGNPVAIHVGQPQCLRFDVKSLAGSVGRMGSNDDFYWMWVTAGDTQKMWWGTWAALKSGRARRVAVNPRQLLDAWLMQPLPAELPDGTKPILIAEGFMGRQRRLLFPAMNSENWPAIQREVFLDPDPPYQPTRVIDRRPDGEIFMDARLGRFTPLDDTGADAPLTARSFDVDWPLGGAVMSLSLDSVRFYDAEAPFCEFDPSAKDAFKGEKECLDEPAARLSPDLGGVN